MITRDWGEDFGDEFKDEHDPKVKQNHSETSISQDARSPKDDANI